ncbi:Aquaporin-1 [Cryomyces antarcticus]|uniref:Aquaporin-1 n=1 Tax=Cryomyces antarcticus TaxID=329879 RepID=A0ABR0MBJ2_9PEZI|nr:Aquaporin-1 [Cryomyces antarcticus]KAK5296695.1 Aquaporin-1 [Cryomyces antarcticus]
MNINEPLHGKFLTLPFTKASRQTTQNDPDEYRLPFARRLPDNIRNHFVASCGEFAGTILFLFFALSGTQVANSIPSSSGLTVAQTGSNPSQLLYIALCFGFSLAVNAWVFFRISGGLFNPAVTLGMYLIGALPWARAFFLFVVQILGGVAAAALVSCMFPGALNVRTELGGGTSIAQGLFIEMILTAELVFTIIMLEAEKHKGTFIAPVGIGLALFIAELTGVYFTGGSLNPARSFGPDVVLHEFHSYHWIYWVGPFLGSILAAGFYKASIMPRFEPRHMLTPKQFFKILEYENANVGQDSAVDPAAGANLPVTNASAQSPTLSRDTGNAIPTITANGHPNTSAPGEYKLAGHDGATELDYLNQYGTTADRALHTTNNSKVAGAAHKDGLGAATVHGVGTLPEPRSEEPSVMASQGQAFRRLADNGMHAETRAVGPVQNSALNAARTDASDDHGAGDRRPRTLSPAMASANQAFKGLAEGGMHADEPTVATGTRAPPWGRTAR